MKRRSISLVLVLTLIINLLTCNFLLFAESGGGDQILDGIGETAMIARYIFNGNAQDRSRNTYHATLHGTGASYVEDSQFGQVLSLPGGSNGNYVQIPGQALIGIDTISITGWIYLRDTSPNQRFFEFGQNAANNYNCTLTDEKGIAFAAFILAAGDTRSVGSLKSNLNQWFHLAVVFDSTAQTLSIYIDGIRKIGPGGVIGKEVSKWTLEKVINQDNAASNLLYIGRAISGSGNLNAKLYDVRLYSVALKDQQVATIRNNALKIKTTSVGSTSTAEPKILSPTPSSNLPQLIAVQDITAETVVGTLPHLPYYIPGKYSNNAGGPLVRVIWPAPTDTNEVRQVGTYKVTGTVAGTDLNLSRP